MNPNELELHDARLIGVATDYVKREATVTLEYYPAADASQRRAARIRFFGMTQVNEVSDQLELEDNARAGNVSYWAPAAGAGTTFLHLVRGLIAITAERLESSMASDGRAGRLGHHGRVVSCDGGLDEGV